MAEYIDKKALITEIQSSVSMVLQTAPYKKVWFDRFVDRQNEIMAIIERQPAAEVEPVRHGKWLPVDREDDDNEALFDVGDWDDWECSECRNDVCYEDPMGRSFLPKYCPNCGARMDGGAGND